jgi:glucokinase
VTQSDQIKIADDALVVGVDIGGTKIAAGLVNERGEIQRHTRAPMMATGSAADGLTAVTSAIEALFAGDPAARKLVRGIGVCCPGPLDPKTGMILNPPNLPCWRYFPLAARLSQHFDVPVFDVSASDLPAFDLTALDFPIKDMPVKVDNDANAAALAEARWGAGRGYRNVFYATIGTGIGTGIVFDGRIYHGRTGAAAEGGHVSIDYRGPRCACGKRGCIEVLAAGPAIAHRARAKVAAEPARGAALLSLAKGGVEAIASETVGQAYTAGDPLAEEILRETIALLTHWLGNIIDLLEPDVIIMGGGVAAMLAPFLAEIRERLPACCINPRSQEIPIVKAFYGAEAGIAGGAALCWRPDASA